MPGYILDSGATVLCAHGGQTQLVTTSPKVKAGGNPVMVQSGPAPISGCAFPPPPAGNGPCVTAQWLTAALRVKAGGMPVLLQDSQALCTPTATPLNIVVTQMKVKAK
ncbi:MAG: hypothetical protein V3W14_06310 [Candidatus Neomarinimicrobiota bacterium]